MIKKLIFEKYFYIDISNGLVNMASILFSNQFCLHAFKRDFKHWNIQVGVKPNHLGDAFAK